ncbi:MAG: hypothetical protein AAFZ80_14085 [Cyanobacteria bacterium P01_A01_bin.105]
MVIAFKRESFNRPGSGSSPGASPESKLGPKLGSRRSSVTALPRHSRQWPWWLKGLVVAQQSSTVLAGGLMAAALMVYSSTVYVDKMVFRTSRELEALKAETQQMTTANETLKHSLAERAAAPRSAFRDYQPDQALFLTPAPARSVTLDEAQTDATTLAEMPRPLGY